jgi:hypothetical protein
MKILINVPKLVDTERSNISELFHEETGSKLTRTRLIRSLLNCALEEFGEMSDDDKIDLIERFDHA